MNPTGKLSDIIKDAGGTPVIVKDPPGRRIRRKSGRYREGNHAEKRNGNSFKLASNPSGGVGLDGPEFEKIPGGLQEKQHLGEGGRVLLATSLRTAPSRIHPQRKTAKTTSSSSERIENIAMTGWRIAITLDHENSPGR